MEAMVMDKVGEVVASIAEAKHVDHVVSALHSLALLLFPLDSSLLAGIVDEKHRNQILSAKVPSEEERAEWWQTFYRGAGFPTMARVLLRDVALNWLACFPISARKCVYDVIFVDGLVNEVVQMLVLSLQMVASDSLDGKAVRLNAERLLILCLLENGGVAKVAREFGSPYWNEDSKDKHLKATVSVVAQLVASIPDKVQMDASVSLSSHAFFKEISVQLLSLAEEENLAHGTSLFVGEIFSRICRRGSVDLLVSEIVPRVLRHVQSGLPSKGCIFQEVSKSNHTSLFWSTMMSSVKDSYAIERFAEQLLCQLSTQQVSDVEAYWTIWLLYHQTFAHHASLRSMFVDKFLLWKVFPICCLRWILHFALFECPPDSNSIYGDHKTRNFIEAVQRLVSVWSKKEFIRSALIEQQIYVSAAIGLALEKISREQLDEIKDVMPSILQGVSSRLESPNHLVRRMASNVALVFSKVIDPNNPLHLDDSCSGETVDWELGFVSPDKETTATNCVENSGDKSTNSLIESNVKSKNKRVPEIKLIDPDEVVDPVTLQYDSSSDKDDDNESENSDSSSDTSLEPYDLVDDDTDLKGSFTQLVDVVRALQKSDNADGVEMALGVAESLVRASPGELKHVAGDLVRTLVQVRCSDLAVEGEEETYEDKRQRALIASVVMSPFESLDTLNKLLYAPTVDLSQRVMILDVMTKAAQELASAKIVTRKHQTKPLISTVSEAQAWFLPSEIGPPGASPWKEVSETGTLLNWANRYERELPPKPGQVTKGKTRKWGVRLESGRESHIAWSHNKFPLYAAAFMLPAMEGFDKKQQGVDLLNRDFIVLGKLIYMLGVCMKCMAMHPEASMVASPLLDMLRSREVCNHKEAYVRRAVLFSASCVLASLHPTYVATALSEGNCEFSNGLEWIRKWALHVAESDTDRECYTMAMACLQLHAEMALQASRALESLESVAKDDSITLPSRLSKVTIKLPFS